MRFVFTLSALILVLPTSGLTQETTPDLGTIIVTGKTRGYVAVNSVTATKTDTPLIDVPQSINVVTRDQLDDQAAYSLSDVLR
jgi:catecholate siderophore receptor